MGALGRRSRWVSLGCLAGALGFVAAAAAWLPRDYMVNDDETITAFLREGTLAPYVEPLLSQGLGASYRVAPEVPWFGLWLYAVYVAALALLARVLVEAPPGAPRALRRALLAGAAVIVPCVAALVFRVTFTTAAIVACGTALVGLAAEVLRASDGGSGVRPGRVLACGLVLAAGMATRTQALGAAAVATTPLLAYAAWRAWRARLPLRPGVLAALLAPALGLYALGLAVPQARDPEARRYLAFNRECNALQLRAAFVGLHRRSPDVLERAGWDRRHYVRFQRWVYLDEAWYTLDRLRSLRTTGGIPREITVGYAAAHARGSSGHGYHLLGTVLVAGLALAITGLGRRRVLGLGLAHVVVLAVAGAALQRWLRLPARVAMPMALLAAAAVWTAARAECDRDAWARLGAVLRARWRRAALGALSVAGALAWLGPALLSTIPPAPEPSACADFERRVVARDPALVVVHAQAACGRDPLRARPRPYPHLSLDWDVFSVPFYRGLARLGISRGAELVPRLVDDPRVYVLAERRFLRALDGMVADDAPGARLDEIDAAGPRLCDLVLLRVVSDGSTPPAPVAKPTAPATTQVAIATEQFR